MKIALGSDHAGFGLKEELKKYLIESGHEVKDFGPSNEESVDYPDFAATVGRSVASSESGMGILICGSGVGVSIAANKIKDVRAVLCRDPFTARLSREHNDTNVLALGAWFTPSKYAEEIVDTWLTTAFQGERHKRRLEKIRKLEMEG
jgi:ribose 5-phosphate isomerase B